MSVKAPSIEVTRWQCGECEATYDEQSAADACCLCACGRTVALRDRRKYGTSKCPRCTLKEAIRHNQESVRRHERGLVDAKRNVERMQAEKRAFDLREKRGEPRLAVEDGVDDEDDGLA